MTNFVNRKSLVKQGVIMTATNIDFNYEKELLYEQMNEEASYRNELFLYL